MSHSTIFLSIAMCCAFESAYGGPVNAAATIVLDPVPVSGTAVFSGPSFVIPFNMLPSDTLSLTASGIVTLQSGAYGTNAAGIVVIAGSTGIGGFSLNGTTAFGSLLLGNATLGFKQVFATSAANGLGSGSPPTTVSITNVPVSVYFSGGLPCGTVLQFRISDTNIADNSGQFTVFGLLNAQQSEVPEPGTWRLTGGGLLIIMLLARISGARYFKQSEL